MRNFGTILVALDFSDCSQELVNHALALADSSTRIVLFHVAELPDGLARTAAVAARAEGVVTAEEQLIERSRERLLEFQRSMSTVAQKVESVVAEGRIAETIVAQAEQHQAELIVMGTHGRRGVSRVVGGSVAAQVITLATCPVLTVRTTHKPTCRAHSCDRCETHLTTELRQLMVERDG